MSDPPDPGPPLERADEEIDRASEVSEADIDDMIAYWHEHAPTDKKGLIDATEPDRDDGRDDARG
jgi:hypothetical protein